MENNSIQPRQEPFIPDAQTIASDTREQSFSAASPHLVLPVGNAMPPMQTVNLPVLHPQVQPAIPGDMVDGGPARTMLAEGLYFMGNAQLRGPCSIAGTVEGNLSQVPGALVSVVVTATGRVQGDITAQKISVMGHTDGVLNSGQGEVSLHDTASVRGLVRYGRIQVNGADLNATLERVSPPSI
jgi:cytoskeletal protein CcmA (bactofilin family)